MELYGAGPGFGGFDRVKEFYPEDILSSDTVYRIFGGFCEFSLFKTSQQLVDKPATYPLPSKLKSSKRG